MGEDKRTVVDAARVKSGAPVLYLEVGTRADGETAYYSDVDMIARKEGGRFVFTRKDGVPYG